MKVLVVVFFAFVASVFAEDQPRTAPYPVPRVTEDSLISAETRIHGGAEANDGDFNFMVFVLMQNSKGDYFRCSGSLVARNWVLLAGHCIIDDITPSDIVLAAGRVDVSAYLRERLNRPFEKPIADNEFGIQERRVTEFHVHPDYNKENLEYDVALLRMKTPFANIPIQELSTERLLEHHNCTLLGWGLIHGDRFDGKLRFVTDVEVSIPVLGCVHKPSGPFICLKTKYSGICQGDSGSPLICDGKTRGVASHFLTEEPKPRCGFSLEEYYSNTDFSRSWILSHTNSSFNSAGKITAGTLVLTTVIAYLSRLSISVLV